MNTQLVLIILVAVVVIVVMQGKYRSYYSPRSAILQYEADIDHRPYLGDFLLTTGNTPTNGSDVLESSL